MSETATGTLDAESKADTFLREKDYKPKDTKPSEREKMEKMMDGQPSRSSLPVFSNEDVIVPWTENDKKSLQGLFLFQQAVPLDEVVRRTKLAPNTLKSKFSTWRQKKMVDGRISKIKPFLHDTQLPTFYYLFLVERWGKSRIIETFGFHPENVDEAFYRLKRERLVDGAPENPKVLVQLDPDTYPRLDRFTEEPKSMDETEPSNEAKPSDKVAPNMSNEVDALLKQLENGVKKQSETTDPSPAPRKRRGRPPGKKKMAAPSEKTNASLNERPASSKAQAPSSKTEQSSAKAQEPSPKVQEPAPKAEPASAIERREPETALAPPPSPVAVYEETSLLTMKSGRLTREQLEEQFKLLFQLYEANGTTHFDIDLSLQGLRQTK